LNVFFKTFKNNLFFLQRKLILSLFITYMVGKDPSIFCFVDESAVGKNASRRRRGWSRRGQPAEKYALFEEGVGTNATRYTLLGAVDINGFIFEACDIVFRRTSERNSGTGTIDANRFVAYVKDKLVPTLGNYDRGEPRSVVVMDNATIHKDPRVLEAIAATGARLVWNAAYSELNPIEMCFHQYKSVLRRNVEEFKIDEIGVHYFALCTAVTRTNMINYYGGTAFEGCIHNLPAISQETKKRKRSESEAKERKRKKAENDFNFLQLLYLSLESDLI
jgi:hypothetical protein